MGTSAIAITATKDVCTNPASNKDAPLGSKNNTQVPNIKASAILISNASIK